jgi:UDP:flavonoid glycosyltransferase YjiC (YdhE family)
MKVLLVPLGSRGDVQPQLVLGEELKRRGHGVTVATAPDFRDWVQGRGLRFIAAGEPVVESLRRNRHMTEQHPALAIPEQLKLTREHTRRSGDELFAAAPEADVVVSAGLSFSALSWAEKLGVPHVFCCYSLSAVYSAEHPPAVFPIYGLPRLANQALWFAIQATLDLGLRGVVREARRSLGLPPHRGSWMKRLARDMLLAQDRVIGELPGDVFGNITHVPALVPEIEKARPLSDLLERFLRGAGEGSSAASPVVYLGFGSMPSVDRARVRRIARELFEQHGARVILFSADGEEDGAEMPPGVFLVGDTDHQSLFPRVDLIVHHGGAGTTAAALRSGVPQLVVPHIVDQFFHGRRIAELGVGPTPVAKNALTTAAIAAALKDRFKYWAKAQTVRTQLHMPGGTRQAADYLESLVRAREARLS